jgi:hypothetical protein
MPELSRFQGLIIQMYFMDNQQHYKPHVHVIYNDSEATVSLDGEILDGSLPRKQMRLLWAWLELHEEELYKAWNNAVRGETPLKISPLQ